MAKYNAWFFILSNITFNCGLEYLLSFYYEQLGTRGYTQKANPVRGVYPKPRSLSNKWPNKLRWNDKLGDITTQHIILS